MNHLYYQIAQGFGSAYSKAGQVATQAQVSNLTLEDYVSNIVSVALTIIGTLFFLLVVYGGFVWTKARGDKNEADRAKEIITMATIGIVVVLIAYAISSFVVKALVASV